MKPRLPPPLAPGDAIGFFSPSAAATAWAPRRFERAQNYLKDQGFRLVPGARTGKSDFYRSGSIRERAEEFNDLVRDPEVRCVMSTIGGSNSNSILPYIDEEALLADPKIIIGYSDVTALLLGIHARTGLVTFQGPALVASFGEFPPLVDETFASFKQILCGPAGIDGSLTYPVPSAWTDERIDWETQDRPKSTQPNDCRFHRGQHGNGADRVRGRIIGGNLNTICAIWGSPYMPPIREGDILLIEDSLKDIATVERLFAFLELNGVLDRVGAILLGKHELFDDRGTGRTPHDVLREVLAHKDPPMVIGFDSCHTHPMLTVPIGITAEIDFASEQISLVEPWLSHEAQC